MRRLALIIEYDGTDYAGWQRQPTRHTIQAAIEHALASLVQASCPIVGAGRTDAGVHAQGQVAHATTVSLLRSGRIRDGLNALLPRDIVVREVTDAAPDFHARRDARLRIYRYVVLARPRPSALLRRYTFHVAEPLDTAAMQAGARCLVGSHDFAAFRVTGTTTTSTLCTLRTVRVESRGDLLIFTVAANRFLRQMVRRVVGSLLMVGRGALAPDAIGVILQSGDNRRAGPPAPAHGLCLVRIVYGMGRLGRRKDAPMML